MHSQRSLTGSQLKWIAIVTMLIDHIGYGLIWNLVLENGGVYDLYLAMRCIGRVAFPIFCFLLVEGIRHTGSRGKYALRLGAFCLVSEIPFDLAFNRPEGLVELGYQNVFFTLFLGYLAMWGAEQIRVRASRPVWILGSAALLFVSGMAAELLSTDYSMFGVLLIGAIYLGRQLTAAGAKWRLDVLFGVLAILWYVLSTGNDIELLAVFGLYLTTRYHGQQGRKWNKWFFYLFYPGHLAVIALLQTILFPG